MTALDRYAARCVNFLLAVTREAVHGARRAPREIGNQPRGEAAWLVSSRRMTAVVVAVLVAVTLVTLGARQRQATPTVAVDADDIGGVVTGPKGPEAGAFVIAETTMLPTRLIKSVVTDDQGRYLIPDLPQGTYDVWVRGYGLVDSQKVKATPGKTVALTAVAAPSARVAAEYYPAAYWLSLLQVPPVSDFPGTGPSGNGISPNIKSQGEWIRSIVNTDGCTGCHQMGGKATREIPEALGKFPNSSAAWDRRIQSGQAGAGMSARFTQVGRARALAMWGDWTDRIAKGELPPAPPRPKGVERNVVVTLWDVGDDHSFMHDEISTDRNRPTVNAGGPVYAVSAGHGQLVILNTREHSTVALDMLPKLRSTERELACSGWERLSPFAIASMILFPPGWIAQPPMRSRCVPARRINFWVKAGASVSSAFGTSPSSVMTKP